MRKKEQLLWDAMKRNAPRATWMIRVENVVSDGMPDVYLVGAAGVCVWIELKAPTRPARDATPLLGRQEGLRQSQINWHMKAVSMGVKTFILVRDDKHALYLARGENAKELNCMSTAAFRESFFVSDWPAAFQGMLA